MWPFCSAAILLLTLLTPRGCESAAVGSRSSASADPQDGVVSRRFCPPDERFCRAEGICLPRATKCTPADGCNSSACLPVSDFPGRFHFALRWEPLPGVWGRLVSRLDVWLHGRQKRRVERLQHLQLLYRGFAYEFGQDYPAVENDPADPYLSAEAQLGPVQTVGTSSCGRAAVLGVAEWWNAAGLAYDLTAHNCQDFGLLLATHLRADCQPPADADHFGRLYAAAKAADPCGHQHGRLDCLRHLIGRLIPGRKAQLLLTLG